RRHVAVRQPLSREAPLVQRGVEDWDLRRRLPVRALPRASSPAVVAHGRLSSGERAPVERDRVASFLGDSTLAHRPDLHLLSGARACARDRPRSGTEDVAWRSGSGLQQELSAYFRFSGPKGAYFDRTWQQRHRAGEVGRHTKETNNSGRECPASDIEVLH